MTISLLQAEASPMMEMNTTPLIDVLLVLLIMFIITVPPITHGIEIDLGGETEITPLPPIAMINKVTAQSNNIIKWNGVPITLDQLDIYLRQTTTQTPEPELQFQPAPNASYDTVDRALAKIKGSGIRHFGFVGNEQYRAFGKASRPAN